MYSRKVKVIAFLSFVFIFGAMRLAPMSFSRYIFRREFPLIVTLLVCLGIVIAVVAWRSARGERKEAQELRDKQAQQIAEETERRLISEIASGTETQPFVLYLRPFALERQFRQWKSETWIYQIVLFATGKVNFDFLLQTYLASVNVLLVSIGVSNDKDGAGHVPATESSWRERFRQLAEKATTIVVVPGIQPSILAEIRWLRVSGLLVNAVFFKPKGYPKKDWQKMQEFYEQEEDIELPDFSPKQISFRMYSTGRCYEVLTWSSVFRKSKKKRGEEQIRAVLTNRPVDVD